MNSKRFLATIPSQTAQTLRTCARQQRVDLSLIVQQAVTEMSGTRPTREDITYIRGDTEGVQVSFSDTAYRLLELWSEQSGLSKSLLVTYSLQKTIETEEQTEKEGITS